MSKEISKQEKEDYLSLMYEMKRKENQIVKSDLSRKLEVPLSRVTRVTDGLLEEGYLLKDEGRRMFLTPMGLSKGQQCLERKRCLTEFLRLVSDVDGSIAKENGKFGILTEALDCTIRRNDKLSEGIVEIVVCDHHEEEIIEESVRILTVSLI